MAFLKYKTGAIPGKPLKRKVTPEETRERKNSMKKTENVNLLILGSRTDPSFITTLNKTLWSATGASKPMDKRAISIYIYSFVILNSGF
jgi:hypothetical protein